MPTDPIYAVLRDRVSSRLIQKYGFPCAIIVASTPTFDPVQGKIIACDTPTIWPSKGIYGGGYTGKRPGVTVAMDGTTVSRKNSKDVYLDAAPLIGLTLTTDMQFKDELGLSYPILNVATINPGGLTMVYIVSVKK